MPKKREFKYKERGDYFYELECEIIVYKIKYNKKCLTDDKEAIHSLSTKASVLLTSLNNWKQNCNEITISLPWYKICDIYQSFLNETTKYGESFLGESLLPWYEVCDIYQVLYGESFCQESSLAACYLHGQYSGDFTFAKITQYLIFDAKDIIYEGDNYVILNLPVKSNYGIDTTPRFSGCAESSVVLRTDNSISVSFLFGIDFLEEIMFDITLKNIEKQENFHLFSCFA
jgi:hypothetical protein